MKKSSTIAIFRVKVPPTRDVGSYSVDVSATGTETVRQRSLWDYNSVRAHDGLHAVSRMPRGTTYKRIK